MKIQKIDINNIPNHVAIIMDGNGTWAKKRGMPRNYGHKRGAKTLLDLVYYANSINIKYLTVFAFSTENWKRPKEEVDYLMKLPIDFINDNEDKLNESDIKVSMIGSKEGIPEELKLKMDEAQSKTKNNNGLHFIIAFNYGSRDEIVRSINKIISDGHQTVNEEIIDKYLDTANIPDVDLLIRTSGQIRISNFLLWQLAYSELHFTDVLWPDFNEKEFNKVLLEYQKRERRFGGLK